MRHVICGPFVAAICLLGLCSCSRNDSEEVVKLKAELAAAKAELAKLKGIPGKTSGNERVTLETFNKIQPGMTYEAVQGLLGDQGRSSWDRNQPPGFGRHWIGRKDMAADPSGPEPGIDVDFEENKVTGKRATNLK